MPVDQWICWSVCVLEKNSFSHTDKNRISFCLLMFNEKRDEGMEKGIEA